MGTIFYDLDINFGKRFFYQMRMISKSETEKRLKIWGANVRYDDDFNFVDNGDVV